MKKSKQTEAMEALEKQGFKFCNWIVSTEESVLMIKKTFGYSKEYRKVDINGTIN